MIIIDVYVNKKVGMLFRVFLMQLYLLLDFCIIVFNLVYDKEFEC